MFFLASFLTSVRFILYFFLAILLLLSMITVHELGHYLVGKIFHFDIEEFSVGLGPKIFQKTKHNGEKFTIRLIPLGGFCCFSGEDDEKKGQNTFYNKKPYQRILVLVAGATMNFIFALIFIFISFSFYGQNAFLISTTPYMGDENISNEYMLKKGDIITEIENKTVYLSTDIISVLSGKKQYEIVKCTVIDKENNRVTRNIKLYYDANFSNMTDNNTICLCLGSFTFNEGQTTPTINPIYTTFIKNGFFTTIRHCFSYSISLSKTIFMFLGNLFTGKLGLNSLGGTITTISVTTKAISQGGFYFLYIASILGINLAIFNLFPIPALDGSKVVFTLIEWVRKKPINRKVEGYIHYIGLILLLIFAIFVDLQRLF